VSDVAWQAMSRGGRSIDFVLEGKMQFRTEMSETGQSLGELGQTTSILYSGVSEKLGGAGAAIGVLGGVQQLIASNAKPRADVRAWDNLPESIHVTTLAAEDGQRLVLELGDATNPSARTLARSLQKSPGPHGRGLLRVRAR